MEYSYPLDLDWSPEEMVKVVDFLAAVEQAYETKISSTELQQKYEAFKTVCPGKAQENNIYKDFKKASGYDGYPVIKRLKEQHEQKVEQWISLKSK